MMRGVLGLYRPEVFCRFILLYLLGCYAAAGSRFVFWSNIGVALCISGISIYAAYALNAWNDADIDAINKPHRPIPAGLLMRVQALTYALLLLALSVLYPLAVFGLSANTALFWWFPFAAVLYSNPWYPLKRKKIPALLINISAVLVTVLLGYILNGGVSNAGILFLLVSLFFASAAFVPLKDLTDVKGDRAYGVENWFSGGVYKQHFLYSVGFLMLALIPAFYSGVAAVFFLFAWSAAAFAALVLACATGLVPVHSLYRAVQAAVFLGALFSISYVVYARFFT